jgi:hypothetical protein
VLGVELPVDFGKDIFAVLRRDGMIYRNPLILPCPLYPPKPSIVVTVQVPHPILLDKSR